MDPVSQQPNNNIIVENTPEQNRLQDLLRNKKILAICGGVLLLLVITGIFLIQGLQEKSESTNDSSNNSPEPSISESERKAIEEQTKVDQAFSDSEVEVKSNYPWIYNLPLENYNYFVYFDLEKKVFVGLLYPGPEDNVEQMKIDIQTDLRDIKKIPIEDFEFEWIVNPN